MTMHVFQCEHRMVVARTRKEAREVFKDYGIESGLLTLLPNDASVKISYDYGDTCVDGVIGDFIPQADCKPFMIPDDV